VKYFLVLLLLALTLFVTGCQDDLSSYSLSKNVFPRWVSLGADPRVLTANAEKIQNLDTDKWTEGWTVVAQNCRASADILMQKKDYDNGRSLLWSAFVYYQIAAFPYLDSIERKKAYQEALRAYLEVTRLSDLPFKRIEIPFDKEKMVAYLRVPEKVTTPPLIVLLPGLDSSKEEMLPMEEKLLQQGWATLSMDFPGTKENPVPFDTDAQRSVLAALNAARSERSFGRIFFLGFSTGGYLALKTAAAYPDTAGVISIGGPVHNFFQSSNFYSLPRSVQKAFKLACQAQTDADLDRILNKLSLKDNGTLDKLNCPILVIDGKNDLLVPASDIYLLSEEKPEGVEVKIFKDDVHAAVNHINDVHALIIKWLDKRTTSQAPSPVRS
jgi:dienelactone hydrolase